MRQAVGFAVVGAVLVLALVAMMVGWRARGRRSASLVDALPQVPAPDALGPVLHGPFPGTYVSTTVAGDWLERVVAHGLGDRSAASVTVHPGGVLVARTGAPDLYLSADRLLGVERAPAMAGKAVGGAGLVVIRWGSTPTQQPAFDTGLRLRHATDRDALTAAVKGLVPPAAQLSSEENA